MTKSMQKEIFLDNEGNEWFERNRVTQENLKEVIHTDTALSLIEKLDCHPKNVLEIGASDGWRLRFLQEKWPDTTFKGIEPSAAAVKNAPDDIHIIQGTADSLPFEDSSFDMVLFGFCLYLCDRSDLFRVAAEADRVLAENGHIITYDFHTEKSYKNSYAHMEGVFSYKMDYSKIFTWNPSYKVVDKIVELHPGCTEEHPDNYVAASALQKNTNAGWPDNPYR